MTSIAPAARLFGTTRCFVNYDRMRPRGEIYAARHNLCCPLRADS
jgi:hypothetical protein